MLFHWRDPGASIPWQSPDSPSSASPARGVVEVVYNNRRCPPEF